MKSERRHQLEQNTLADYLGKLLLGLRPLVPYAAAAVAIFVVGSVIYAIYSSSQLRSSSTAWSDFYFRLADNEAASFEDMADMFPNTPAGRWARLRAADRKLQRGIQLLYSDRQEGAERIDQAITNYERVVESAREPLLRAFAQFGLAKAHEALGELEEATTYYQLVVESPLPPSLKRYAAERLEFLNSPEGREFYAWFEEHAPQQQSPLSVPGVSTPTSDEPTLQFSSPDESTSSVPLDPSVLPELPNREVSPASAPADDSAESPSANDSMSSIPLPSEEQPPATTELPVLEPGENADAPQPAAAAEGSDVSEPASVDAPANGS
ncbi:MAG: hypothetical protein KatS3mg111_1581 [Pirellulaceae bacterium]|nr:MAG: hypothetical protein KatS3mg111_1581 [Pirellulaceae bacterium]